MQGNYNSENGKYISIQVSAEELLRIRGRDEDRRRSNAESAKRSQRRKRAAQGEAAEEAEELEEVNRRLRSRAEELERRVERVRAAYLAAVREGRCKCAKVAKDV